MVFYNIVKITKNNVVSNETIEVHENHGKINIHTLNEETNQDFDLINEYVHDDMYYCVVGNVTNNIPGNENIYELPPPYDTILYFNDLYIIKCKSFKRESCRKIENLSIRQWNQVYETLFGGFESLGEDDDTDSYDEELDILPNQLTKSGYMKDDFVVSDDNEEDEVDEDEDNPSGDEEEYEEEEEEDDDNPSGDETDTDTNEDESESESESEYEDTDEDEDYI